MPCVLNAANEVAVAEFLKDNIGFLEMEDYVYTDRETRIRAYEMIHASKLSNTAN
jgi:1-deoxy-D-xylulose-5-phosphate reductoisomerase